MDKIEELLFRGVEKIYPSNEELEKTLRSGKKLTLFQGFDPTGTLLHIGHMVGLLKLSDWQKMGHKVIFLIGDGTGQAGDPSGKLTARERFLTNEELKKNAEEYVKQASKIVNFEGENPVEIKYNGDWLNKLKLIDILEIAGHFSLQQLSERDLFQERIKKGEDVNLREFLYPLLQGYDSVAMNVDLEIGGNDQTFNMLAGRKLMREVKGKEKFVMTTPILADNEGRKIGKTEGNVIAITDNPIDLYKKIMTLTDDIIVKGFQYLTRVSMEKVSNIKKRYDEGESPINLKKELAFEIVKLLNNEVSAKLAQDEFERVVQKKDLPAEIPTVEISSKDNLISYVDLLVNFDLASSKSEAKRLIEQGGVEIDNEKIQDPHGEITINDEIIVKVGKRKFIKVVIAR